MLATYAGIEVVAMYYYCRSLLCDNPFAGGLDNLKLLFEKNAHIARQLDNAGKAKLYLAASALPNGHERRRKEIDVKMKIFLNINLNSNIA